jgi:hypothetical protein
MRHAGGLVSLLIMALASHAWAGPTKPAARKLAEAPVPLDEHRVVVSEGDAKSARLVNELEQELKASAYVIVRVPRVALDPASMLQALRDAHAARGILLSEDGKSVIVLAASRGGTTLRVYGEYSLDRDNRLARRRQWIALVERLRVSPDDEEGSDEPALPIPAATATVTPRRYVPTGGEPPDLRVYRLGVTVALGYVTERTGLVSHMQLVGNYLISPRITLIAHGLWPLVPGERTTSGEVRSRVWTFVGNVGLSGDLGRPTWWANPYLGMTVGMQFLLGYVDRPDDATTATYKIGSLALDLHAGVRLLLRSGAWLLAQVSAGRLNSLATRSEDMTDALADGWSVRSALGLIMAL